MVGSVRTVFGVVLSAAAAWLSAPAFAASGLEKNFWLEGPRYEGTVPLCDEPAALDRIMARFAEKEQRFWNSDIAILGIDQVREVAFRPWDRDLIPRRFCAGRASLSDGHVRSVYYWIGEDAGQIGASWGVQWCVVGYDRNWAYNPTCRMAQP